MLVVEQTVRDYLTALAARSRDILGRDLVGVYAAGSIALEAYRPGRSDVDVAVVRKRRDKPAWRRRWKRSTPKE